MHLTEEPFFMAKKNIRLSSTTNFLGGQSDIWLSLGNIKWE